MKKKRNIIIISVIAALIIIAVVLLLLLKQNKITISFDTNGGTVVDAIEIKKGERIKLPTTTKENYVFEGWYLKDTKVNNKKVYKESTKLKAHWIKEDVKTFVVTFDSDGGSKVESITLEDGQKLKLPANPKKDGYEFKGWYDKNEMPILDDALLACEDITLTAKWEKEESNVVIKKEETKKNEPKKEVKYSCETGWVLNGDKCEYTHRTTPKPNCGYGLHYDSKNKQCYYEVDMEMGCPDFNGYSGSSAYYDETAEMCYYAKNSETSSQGCISHGMWKDGACYGINTSAKLICEQGTEKNGMCVVRRSASYTCDEGYDLSGNYCLKKDVKPATAN